MATATATAEASKRAMPNEEESKRLLEEFTKLCIRGDAQAVGRFVEQTHPDWVKAQFNSVLIGQEGGMCLHIAARNGHLRLTQELITRRAQVTAVDSSSRSPLHIACEDEHTDVALELLLANADANAQDQVQQTALHRAVQGRNVEAVQVLLEHGGADPAIPDGTGASPLLLAAEYGRPEFIEVLLAKDPSIVHATNLDGWTALHLAAHGHDTRRSWTPALKFATAVRILLAAKADVNYTDDDKKTALHRAAASGNVETMKALMEGGANVSARDGCRWQPLHYACEEGHFEAARLLLEAKAEVEHRTPPCLNPLGLAVQENQVKMAELLMKYNADPNLRCKGTASPMMMVRQNPKEHNEILALFELGFIHHAPAVR